MAAALVSGLLPFTAADASSVSSAGFSGGANTVSVGGVVYAKSGGALTLTVNTSTDTKCVQVTGSHSGRQTSSNAKSNWTFEFTAGAGDGVQSATAAASSNFNSNNCTGLSQTPQSASYVLDNTGPVVSAAVTPAVNAAGWNNSNIAIAWTASDAGSGVASGPTPASDSVSANTAGTTKTSTATDRLGNVGNGSVLVKVDKAVPAVSASVPGLNANGWVNTLPVTATVNCSDAESGIKSCTSSPSPATITTEGANKVVSGTATDNADNTRTTSVTFGVDTTKPTLSGAPTTSPNGAGWYKSNVTIDWTCADALSGIDGTCPADGTINSEGTGLTLTQSVSDQAGNTTSAISSPAVKIDKTAPVTAATAPTAWNNVDVTVTLSGNDALSGVKSTSYMVDGGAIQTGTSVQIGTEGDHTLEYWSTDNADNTEAHKTVSVKIDKTPPTINHTQSPPANANGWNNGSVTVTFTCSDSAGSGIHSCGHDETLTTEGASQVVTGTAVDNAGNSATDPATVSIDLTKPTIGATRDRAANANGWYDADATVTFACADALSGIDSCTTAATLGEGAGQSASGTAVDAAGNSATVTESGINVDKTAPALSGAATTSPNADGWYEGDVTIDWTASDALSGVAAAPGDDVLTGEGSNVCAARTVEDRAGNTTTKSVCVKIDRHAPDTLASVPGPLPSGWYAGAVPVTLTASDPLSGVDTTYYSVDGGAAQVYGGVFEFATKGTHTITFWSVDNAGNTEGTTGRSITLKIDGVAPTITGSRIPLANGFGWNNVPVGVSFSCSDAESGIAACTGDQTLSNEGAGQSATGNALDNAGNDASAAVGDINIDVTAPTLAGSPTTDVNGAGWYRANVVIDWTASDALSGVDPATDPADSTVTGEGRNLGAGPVSVSDKAGNAASASVSGIKIDRTGPSIAGGPTTAANGAGWHSGDVVVDFTCSDPNLADATAGSGVANCPSSKLISGSGANQSVTSDPATDYAGNTTAGKTIGGINIDGLVPQSTANNTCNAKNGYCKGSTATVEIGATDQPGLSGVKEIRYRLNGGPELVKAGSTATVVVPLNGSGVANVAYWAVDNADNAERQNGIALKYDNIAPTVTHTVSPTPNADEWNKEDLTVRFGAKDDDTGSGVNLATVTPDQLVTAETPGTVVNGSAEDLAGNLGTDSVTIKLDKTPPTITGAITAGTAGSNGWYTGPVTVTFTCADGLSTIAVCPDPVVVSANGAGQSVTRTAYDKAGNQKSATVSGISVDSEEPDITLQGVAQGGTYKLGSVPTASCTARDSVSGPDGCTVTVTGGLSNGVGTYDFSATGRDKAGNVDTLTGSYRVTYADFGGFLQPINDTAHQIGAQVSIFKAASTVPVKFQLRRADGSIVQASTAPQWLTPAKGSLTTAAVDEALYGDQATTGTTFRWDSTAQQYIYNWGTAKNQAGYFWRIGVKLDDGTTYMVSIGLR